MELTFVIKITVGYDIRNCTKQCFTLDYEPSNQDYEEFAKKCGWNNALDFLSSGNEEFTEEIKLDLKNNNCSCLDYYLDKHSCKLFEEFLVDKYQDKFEEWLVEENLTLKEDDLNDILAAK